MGIPPDSPPALDPAFSNAALIADMPPAAEAAFDRARIFVLESGSPEMREISVGIQDLDFFEIADGEVEEGDLIIVGPADDAR